MISMFFLMISMFLLKNACTIFPQKTLPLQSFFCENRPSNDYPTADAERPSDDCQTALRAERQKIAHFVRCQTDIVSNAESVFQRSGRTVKRSDSEAVVQRKRSFSEAVGQRSGLTAKRSKYNQLNKQKQL